LRLWPEKRTIDRVFSLSPHIVDDRQRDLIAAGGVRSSRRRRSPFGAVRGVRMLRRAPRRAAA
jgi:hypothetical protein